MTQVPVLGFNSANYTCLSTPELKFLDIGQFLAAGSSYSSFLEAYKVEEHKGYFPYEWFDAARKLEHPELPPHTAFHSSLKNSNITLEEYDFCKKIWEEKQMTTFKEFLEWYNNLDVKPFVTAVERLQQFYFKEGIDVFKTAISVPGIARRMLFKCAKQQKVNFALCDRNNVDLYNTIKNGIVGGPSIIFKRHAKKGITRICGGKLCQSVVGYDANALYLWAINQYMPTGPFIRRTAPDFKPEVRDNYMAAYHWMDFLMHTSDVCINHQLNSGKEVRIGPYPVDGFQVNGTGEKPTVYQFHGCYFHGHSCSLNHNIKDKKWLDTREKKYKKTKEITNYLKASGCHVIEKWECEYRNECQRNPVINHFINSTRPSFYRKHREKVTEHEILKAVVEEELFGIIEVAITVPDHWMSTYQHPSMTPYEYFQEMCPLFCNTLVPFDSIGDHMKVHVEQHGLSKHDRRLLVAGLSAEKILLATPLLRWYLLKGLVVSRIYQVVEYQKQRCFTDFVNKVSSCRRNADENPDTSIIADTMKVIGNSAYGSLIMDKAKHRNIVYVQGENKTCLKVNEPQFRKLECLDIEEEFYELSMAKRLIRLDLPIQLGFFILQYAKLHML
ncbi:hypothetical protein KUTeg_012039 [Tegillarca granosa]|uniref:DNA-directed DNA polymerase n=1 Tax=Tegillarca granosa TaxID=220873 RepID=A0ABQ9EYD8_TEGGR|nr:hypothetical protein KUTeg_012039 [Tegillarca granosa]